MKSSQEVKKVLQDNDIYAKKSLGQNFLVCDWVYDVILEEAQNSKSQTILEVGPGPGILTEKLAQTGKKVVAVEKDHRMIFNLQALAKKYPNLHIIEEDILKIEPRQIIGDGNYQIIGNIPYYLTSHLVRQIFETWPKPENIIFMIQKEVAKRIVAKPPDMSLLAISVAFYAQAKILKNVGRNCFRPAPKVDSALIKFTPHNENIDNNYEKEFFKVAKAGFAEARKQIINNLSSGLKMPKESIIKILESADIDAKARAETLDITKWHQLTKSYMESL